MRSMQPTLNFRGPTTVAAVNRTTSFMQVDEQPVLFASFLLRFLSDSSPAPTSPALIGAHREMSSAVGGFTRIEKKLEEKKIMKVTSIFEYQKHLLESGKKQGKPMGKIYGLGGKKDAKESFYLPLALFKENGEARRELINIRGNRGRSRVTTLVACWCIVVEHPLIIHHLRLLNDNPIAGGFLCRLDQVFGTEWVPCPKPKSQESLDIRGYGWVPWGALNDAVLNTEEVETMDLCDSVIMNPRWFKSWTPVKRTGATLSGGAGDGGEKARQTGTVISRHACEVLKAAWSQLGVPAAASAPGGAAE